MAYLTAAIAGISVIQAWCLWRVLNRLGALGDLETRLTAIRQTLLLLTDTTETGFHAMATQLVATAPAVSPARTRATRQRRIVGAARKGRSVAEIAAAEDVAQGEVHLRLHLAEAADLEQGHGALRA